MECSTDILNKILEDKSSKAAAAAKRKTMSSKDANEQYANDLLQASAFAALRTRPAVDSALWEVRSPLLGDFYMDSHLKLALFLVFTDGGSRNFEPRYIDSAPLRCIGLAHRQAGRLSMRFFV